MKTRSISLATAALIIVSLFSTSIVSATPPAGKATKSQGASCVAATPTPTPTPGRDAHADADPHAYPDADADPDADTDPDADPRRHADPDPDARGDAGQGREVERQGQHRSSVRQARRQREGPASGQGHDVQRQGDGPLRRR